jgi:hypothetical protein
MTAKVAPDVRDRNAACHKVLEALIGPVDNWKKLIALCCSGEPTVFTLLRIFSIVGIEYILNATLKQAGNFERQWQSRIVFSGLDGIDGLSGNLKLLSKCRL